MPRSKLASPNHAAATVAAGQEGFRADRALAALLPDLGRRAAKILFHTGAVRLNGKRALGSERVRTGDRLEFPDPNSTEGHAQLERVQAPRLTTPHGRHLVRLYEDDQVLVVSKPAEIPVHRGQGGFTRRDTIEDVVERAYPGGFYFVHRLDQETSGCLLIAKSAEARDKLIQDFMSREVHKEYLAVVVGEVPWDRRTVKRPITYVREGAEAPPPRRNEPAWVALKRRGAPLRSVKKGVALDESSEAGKASETLFTVLKRFKGYTLLRCVPRTGRTHQLRVHLLAEGFPLAYDPLYGRRSPLRLREFDLGAGHSEKGERVALNRLPLHAERLSFNHPASGERVDVEAPMPRDLKAFLWLLRKFRSRGGPLSDGNSKRGAAGMASRANRRDESE